MRFHEKYVRLEGRKVYHKGSAKLFDGLKQTRCGISVFSHDEVLKNRPHKNLCKNCMGTRGE